MYRNPTKEPLQNHDRALKGTLKRKTLVTLVQAAARMSGTPSIKDP